MKIWLMGNPEEMKYDSMDLEIIVSKHTEKVTRRFTECKVARDEGDVDSGEDSSNFFYIIHALQIIVKINLQDLQWSFALGHEKFEECN
jgi:hypothetical protein